MHGSSKELGIPAIFKSGLDLFFPEKNDLRLLNFSNLMLCDIALLDNLWYFITQLQFNSFSADCIHLNCKLCLILFVVSVRIVTAEHIF